MLSNVQFTAVVVMSLLTMVLAVLPQRVARNRVADRSRWLMAAATGLLALQFALQYKLKLRDMGVTQAVMLNLPFFIFASILLSIALLNLQRQGRELRQEWMVGAAAWMVTVGQIAGAAFIDGQPLLSDTKELRMAEASGSILYALMQAYYSLRTLREMRRMRLTVAAYYDREMSGILNWMERSVWLLTVIAILVPLMIFTSGSLLRLFSFLTFMAMFYLVIYFLCYLVSNDQQLVEIADESRFIPDSQGGLGQGTADNDSTPFVLDEKACAAIANAVTDWTARGGHLRHDLNIQTVADEMHVQRSHLSGWLKTTEWEVFATWLTHLRIEEAKNMLKEHSDWGNDYVAQRCGFSSRTYFQKKFKEIVGETPGEFAAALVAEEE